MKRSDLTEFEVEEEGFKIKIKRSGDGQTTAGNGSADPFAGGTPAREPARPSPAAATPAPPPAAADETGFTYVKSPMVGTFYRNPSPDSPPFADVNTRVEEKTVVCIIEAMKIMNEIQ